MKKNNLVFSLIVTVVFAVLLTLVNTVTAPIILENEKSGTFGPLFEVMADAENFELICDQNSNDFVEVSETIENVYRETSGKGYVFNLMSNKGYTGDYIKFTLGIDSTGKITGTKLNAYPETKDFGEDYPLSYIGEDSTLANINLVAGVTFSSSAYKNAVIDAFTFLAANNMVAEATKSDEQILAENLPIVFSGIANPSGILQAEEVSANDFAQAYKANNETVTAFVGTSNDKLVLVGVNNANVTKIVDAEGNEIADEALSAKAVNASLNKAVSKKELKKINKLLGVEESNPVSFNSFNCVAGVYEASGNYGFVVRPYGYSNQIMGIYVVLDGDGKVVSISADELVLQAEYCESCKLDETSYLANLVGKDAINEEDILVAGVTMTSNATKQAMNDVFETFASLDKE